MNLRKHINNNMLISNKDGIQYIYIDKKFYEIVGTFPYEKIINVEYRLLLLSNIGNIYRITINKDHVNLTMLFDSRIYGKFIKILMPPYNLENLKGIYVIYENYYIYMNYKNDKIEFMKKEKIKEKISDAYIRSDGMVTLITEFSYICYYYMNQKYNKPNESYMYMFEGLIHENDLHPDIFSYVTSLRKRNKIEVYENMSIFEFYVYLWYNDEIRLYCNNKYVSTEYLEGNIISVKNNIFITEKYIYLHYSKCYIKVRDSNNIKKIDSYKNLLLIVTTDNMVFLYKIISVLINGISDYIPFIVFEDKFENCCEILFYIKSNTNIYIGIYTKSRYYHVSHNENAYMKIGINNCDLSCINADSDNKKVLVESN